LPAKIVNHRIAHVSTAARANEPAKRDHGDLVPAPARSALENHLEKSKPGFLGASDAFEAPKGGGR
jgi:hypothetical protein